jgi:hypothetical protein
MIIIIIKSFVGVFKDSKPLKIKLETGHKFYPDSDHSLRSYIHKNPILASHFLLGLPIDRT